MSIKLKASLLLALVFAGCASPSLFHVTNERSYEKTINQHHQLKIIFISDQDIPGNDALIQFLNKQQWTKFDERVKSISDVNSSIFLRSIRLLMSKQYLASYQLLKNLPATAYDCQVAVLRADCLHALKADSVNIPDKYQKALDCTQDQRIKAIVKTRYRFTHYGY